MSNISGIIIVLSVLSVFLLIKHLALKRQIRNLSKQVGELSDGSSEKMLDVSLIDKDLEELAGMLNQVFAGQRYSVACALRHEEHQKEAIANISHDLRTPLTVIIGHLQLLQSSDLTEKQKQRVEIALCKAMGMKELTRAFYDLSILDADRIEPRIEKLNFSNVLIDFLAENALLFENSQIQPEIILPETSIFIQADANMLERILQNLLTNAVRYSAGVIRIQLSASPEGRAALTIANTVRDTADIDVGRLFDRFYTGDKSRHGDSTGLGLAVVKMLAEKLGGEIRAEMQLDIMSITLKL